jgi:hypothetical protein
MAASRAALRESFKRFGPASSTTSTAQATRGVRMDPRLAALHLSAPLPRMFLKVQLLQ